MTSMTTADLEQLVEGHDLEAKLAAGRDGRGELPSSFFETYSAFANTDGGIVLLGVEELSDGKLVAKGMTEPARVVRALWDGLNNTQRVNANLLRELDVETLDVEGKAVIRIAVPRATRRQRPVYVGQNPLTGSFRRNNEGDYRCPEEVVRRIIAEQVEDTRDAHVLRGFGVGDLDATTIAKYRQRYQTRSPDHPWNSLDEKEFLRSIGAFGSDREADIEGLTSAGLLMFGKLVPIKDAFPNYMLDFQERADARPDSRWVDRLTTDGTWSGNLFDFYALAIQRLFRDLRVPFQLRGDTRIDETPVHEALREALVNTLIHADYTGRVSVLVVKRSDLFAFRNPGAMRMPVETALRGGVSDCRNRRLQDMFRYVGLGEQAGSGIPKIQSAWRTQHWRSPEMVENVEPYEQTIFTLRMASLLPGEVVQALEQRFGAAFDQASEVQKLALVAAAVEHSVTHARLRSMTDVHPRDVTVALSSLVQRGMLESGGAHKRTYYFLPGERPAAEATPVSFELPLPGMEGGSGSASSLQHKDASLQHSGASLQHNEPSLQHNGASLQHNEPEAPLSADLEARAAKLRARKRARPEEIDELLLALCAGRFLSVPDLARLTGRSISTLRTHYLPRLVENGSLTLQYPDQPTHPAQAYRTVAGKDGGGC